LKAKCSKTLPWKTNAVNAHPEQTENPRNPRVDFSFRSINLNTSTWGCREQERAPRWVSPPRSLGSNRSRQQPKGFGGRVGATTAEPRARRPAQSCLCGGQKKRGFIAANIGPLCAAFLALCRGTASVCMAALDGEGHFTALKGHSVNVKGPPCLATAASAAPSTLGRMPRAAGNAGELQPGATPSPPGALLAPTAGTSVAGEGGRDAKIMMAWESEVGWGPLRCGTRRSSKTQLTTKSQPQTVGPGFPEHPLEIMTIWGWDRQPRCRGRHIDGEKAGRRG